ncbi:MAG: hypothetical protein JKY01_02300 [Pseudomonadales bacterium]|nr:hypothetical protein [Pseudomonadales bacterium]
MKIVIRNIMLFVLCHLPVAAAWSANDSSECCQAILANRDFTLDKPATNIVDDLADSVILTASSVAAIPTLAASLPVGVLLVIGHRIGSQAVKEVKITGHNRLLALLKESALFVEGDSRSLDGFPVLKELWYRVNGPIFKTISPREVADSVLKAEYDIDFCSDAGNYRLVHFKDYVLDDING